MNTLPPDSNPDLFDELFPGESLPTTRAVVASTRILPADGEVGIDEEVDLFDPKLRVEVIPPASTTLLDADAQHDLQVSQDRLGDALPKDGLIAEFVRYAIPVTNAPTEFHLAAILNAIAATLGNTVKIRKWKTNIYPNLWTLIVAPTGNWHKTTSINISTQLLARAGFDVKLPNDFSREAAISAIAAKPSGLMVFGEFGSFLNTAHKDFGQGLVADFTALYDGDDVWTRKLMKDTITISRPAPSIFAASTRDWIQELVGPADLRSGFFHRFMFVLAATKNTNRRGSGDDDQVAENRLIYGLNRISRIAPRIDPTSETAVAKIVRLTDEADKMWNAYLDEIERNMDKGDHADFLSGFLSRLQATSLKLAMVYQASACAFDPSKNPLVIEPAAMKSAIAYCRLIWGNSTHFFENEWATGADGIELQRVIGLIGSGCERTVALKRFHGPRSKFNPLIETLIETDQIRQVMKKSSELGRTVERDRDVAWLEPGDEHSSVKAAKRNAPKPKPRAKEDWEQEADAEWDAASDADEPIIPIHRPKAA